MNDARAIHAPQWLPPTLWLGCHTSYDNLHYADRLVVPFSTTLGAHIPQTLQSCFGSRCRWEPDQNSLCERLGVRASLSAQHRESERSLRSLLRRITMLTIMAIFISAVIYR
jgi:hypothetical protein